MLRAPLPLLLLAVTAPAAAAADDLQLSQVIIRERITVRLPRMAPPPQQWREKKGPSCVPVATMAGAMIVSPRQVDLVLQGGKRVRAVLDGDCDPLDFYSGFYIRPGADGKACAGRDAIRVRSGASCDIDRFRSLVPAK